MLLKRYLSPRARLPEGKRHWSFLAELFFAFAGEPMLRLFSEQKIYAYREAVDMRKSFDGLVAVTKHLVKENPLSGAVFVFRNKRGNYLKLLMWDRTGYVLYAKRLERGRFKIFFSEEKQMLSREQLSFLLDGIPLGVKRDMR
jgi:transposase